MPYVAPVEEMRFVLDTLAPLDGAVERDVADAILGEAAKFAAAELDPLNQPADRIGSVLETASCARRPDFARPIGAIPKPAGWVCNAIPPMAARACPSRSRQPSWRCGIRPA